VVMDGDVAEEKKWMVRDVYGEARGKTAGSSVTFTFTPGLTTLFRPVGGISYLCFSLFLFRVKRHQKGFRSFVSFSSSSSSVSDQIRASMPAHSWHDRIESSDLSSQVLNQLTPAR